MLSTLQRTVFGTSKPGHVFVVASFLRRYSSLKSEPVIPVVDISSSYSDRLEDRLKVASDLDRACRHLGFLSVVGHNVPPDRIQAFSNVTREYFDLPTHEKRKIPMTETYPYGYSGYGEESQSRGYGNKDNLPDLKESFAIGPYNTAAHMDPIRWPERPIHFKPLWLEYYAYMENLAGHLLRLLALGLKLEETWFDNKIDHHRSALRALNYPEQDRPPLPGQARASEHTDYGSLTILLQDKVGGLQVKNKQGQWQDIPHVPGAYVINLGDLMSRWTNDLYVSTVHRVVNPPVPAGRVTPPRRQSVAFFHNINHDAIVECLPTCQSPTNPPKYPPINAWDMLMQKHLASIQIK